MNDLSDGDLEKWDAFWRYFDTQWMRQIEDWSFCHENGEFTDYQNRTNNALERYNRKINEIFATPHPRMNKSVTLIEKDARYEVVRLNNIRSGLDTAQDHLTPYETIPDEYTMYEPEPPV